MDWIWNTELEPIGWWVRLIQHIKEHWYVVELHWFTHLPYSFSMPSTSSAKAGANKGPAAKALVLKEAAARKAAVKSLTKKAATSGKRSGNPPAGAPASSADPDPEDQAAEMMILRGEYCVQQLCAREFISLFYLAQLAGMQLELKTAQEEAGSCRPDQKKSTKIERPHGRIGNLRVAMRLARDPMRYDEFCVSFSFFFLLLYLTCIYYRRLCLTLLSR